MILKSHSLRQCLLITENDFQLQLRLRLITTLKKQTMTNNDHDNDLIIPDFATQLVGQNQKSCEMTI